MARAQNFRDLIEWARRKGLARTARPRSAGEIAAACCISTSSLYFLMDGKWAASETVVALIARGLGRSVTIDDVQRALDKSRKEAEVTT